jgi:hypothetical protein
MNERGTPDAALGETPKLRGFIEASATVRQPMAMFAGTCATDA